MKSIAINTAMPRHLSPWIPEKDPIRLAILGKALEECGELVKILARCVIQGSEEIDPSTLLQEENRVKMAEEIADVLAGIELAVEHFELPMSQIIQRRDAKMAHLTNWHELISVETNLE